MFCEQPFVHLNVVVVSLTKEPQWVEDISMFYSTLQLVVFVGVLISYGGIWFKIKSTTQLMNADTKRYQNSARLMMIFVVVFIFQWWPNTLLFLWGFVSTPPPQINMLSGFIINMGGVCNCIAYTFIRRSLQKEAATEERSVVIKELETASVSSVASTAIVDTIPWGNSSDEVILGRHRSKSVRISSYGCFSHEQYYF